MTDDAPAATPPAPCVLAKSGLALPGTRLTRRAENDGRAFTLMLQPAQRRPRC